MCKVMLGYETAAAETEAAIKSVGLSIDTSAMFIDFIGSGSLLQISEVSSEGLS